MIHLAPSILAANFANLEHDIKAVEQAGATFIHVDIMDGHFVPNISIGPPVVKALRPHITGIMDVHLMIENPDNFVKDFCHAGADYLMVHVEACTHLHRTLSLIKSYGVKAGVVLNPATPIYMIEPILDCVDMILLMSVNPGFGGQKFIPSTLSKLKQLKALIGDRNILIQVDGGIDLSNVESVLQAGANVIVAGSAIFNAPDVDKRINEFFQIIERYNL